jgi:hypothetical protein
MLAGFLFLYVCVYSLWHIFRMLNAWNNDDLKNILLLYKFNMLLDTTCLRKEFGQRIVHMIFMI